MKKLILITLFMLSPLVFASEPTTKLYSGLSGGISHSDDISGYSGAYGIFVGYQFNRYISTEISYDSLWSGSADFGHGIKLDDLDVTAVRGSMLLSAPMTDNFSAYLRAGYAAIEVDGSIDYYGYKFGMEEDYDGLFGGIGVRYDFERIFFRYELTTLDDSFDDVSFTLAAAYRF